MMGAAGAVHFAGSNAGNAQARTFRTPDWPITIPHTGGRAGEGLPCGNHGCGHQAKHVDTSSAQCPPEPEDAADDIEHALLKAAPTGVRRVVAENRNPLALRLDRDPLDAQHVVHAQHIDPVA